MQKSNYFKARDQFLLEEKRRKDLKLQHEGIRLDIWKDFLIEMVSNPLEGR